MKRRVARTALLALAPGILLLEALSCGAPPGQHNRVQPPGATPPPGDAGSFSDAAGRLYALVMTLPSAGPPSTTLTVVNARDGSLVGAHALDATDPSAFAVDAHGNAWIADKTLDLLEVVDPDAGFGTTVEPFSGTHAIAEWTDFNSTEVIAIVSATAATLTHSGSIYALDQTVLLPSGGGPPLSTSFSANGGLLAIARAGAPATSAPPDVVVAQNQPNLVSIAYRAPLSASGCAARVDDVAFAAFDPVSSPYWLALDLSCDRLYAGSAAQSTGRTIVFGAAAAPALHARHRLAVDGWTDVAWVSDGSGLRSAELDTNTPDPLVASGPTTAVALGYAGTLLWVGAQSGSSPVLTQVDTGARTGTVLTSLPTTGYVADLAYRDRPPQISAPDHVGVTLCTTNDVIAFQVGASDPDGDPVVLSLPDPPPGASFDGTEFKWSPASPGLATIQFDAISGEFLSSRSVDIVVSDCPPPPTPTPSPTPTPAPKRHHGGCDCSCSVGAGPDAGSAPGSLSLVVVAAGLLAAHWRRRERA